MNLKCGWQIFIAFISVNSVIADSNNKEFLDLMNTEDNIVIWQNLFIKINKILSETMKLNERQNNLENEMLDLKKRLDENKLVAIKTLQSVETLDQGQTELKATTVQILQNMQKHSEELKKVQTEQNVTLHQLKGNEEIHFKELEKKTDEHKSATGQLMVNVEKHFKNLEQGQSENVRNLTSYINPWITFLRRQDGSVNFTRNWTDYKIGFGNTNGEFFLGLDKLHTITNEGQSKELRIVLIDFEGELRYANYDLFRIGNEAEIYNLKDLSGYSGNAGDYLRYHVGQKFSTYDQDNDFNSKLNCARVFMGGWWFKSCYESHLTGPYRSKNDFRFGGGVRWGWKQNSFKYVEMKIRNKVF